MAVTYNVARTRITMALSVVATINKTVKMERSTCFMGGEAPNQPKHNAFAAKAECGDGVRRSWTGSFQRRPDQSSATTIESLGLAGSYFTLVGYPVTRRSKRTWLSSPVMSCAV